MSEQIPNPRKETETHYILTASVAGFKPEQIAVSVEPQCVTVWCKAPTTAESEAGRPSDAISTA